MTGERPWSRLSHAEADRMRLAVAQRPCPQCPAGPGETCDPERRPGMWWVTHIARYWTRAVPGHARYFVGGREHGAAVAWGLRERNVLTAIERDDVDDEWLTDPAAVSTSYTQRVYTRRQMVVGPVIHHVFIAEGIVPLGDVEAWAERLIAHEPVLLGTAVNVSYRL